MLEKNITYHSRTKAPRVVLRGRNKFNFIIMEKTINYTLTAHKMLVGKQKGEVVMLARPTNRKRIAHRDFCEEVAHATTFTGAEVEAVLRLAAEMAKKHVAQGEAVDFGDIGTFAPTFKAFSVKKEEDFNPQKHIHDTRVSLRPNRKYFTLKDVNFTRVAAPVKGEKKKPEKPKKEEETGPQAG